MDINIWSLGISILALVISILEMYHNHILNKPNLRSEHFADIYNDYLFKKIPQGRDVIKVSKGRFVGFKNLQDTITDMVSALSFFKFADGRFYEMIRKECMSLEDYLLNTANKKNITLANPCSEVDEKLKKIYKIINNKREKGSINFLTWKWWKLKNRKNV